MTTSRVAASPGSSSPGSSSPELLRALGSVATSPPPCCHPVAESLGLPAPTAAEHTGVFVLAAPPHAAIHLGEQGKLGGEGLDRVAGFWRAIGLRPPQDADHLGALLMLYAELSDAQMAARSEATRDQLRHAREALLFEHLWSWAPGYLTAVARLGAPSLAAWAQLTLSALGREARRGVPPRALPLALRMAPAPGTAATSCSTRWSRRCGPASCLPVPTYARPPQRRAWGTAWASGGTRCGRCSTRTPARRWAGWAATPAGGRHCTPPSSPSADMTPGPGGPGAPHAPPAPCSDCKPGLPQLAKVAKCR